MQVEEVGRVVICLKDSEILLPEMGVARLATVESEEEGKVGVIRVEQVEERRLKTELPGTAARNALGGCTSLRKAVRRRC